MDDPHLPRQLQRLDTVLPHLFIPILLIKVSIVVFYGYETVPLTLKTAGFRTREFPGRHITTPEAGKLCHSKSVRGELMGHDEGNNDAVENNLFEGPAEFGYAVVAIEWFFGLGKGEVVPGSTKVLNGRIRQRVTKLV